MNFIEIGIAALGDGRVVVAPELPGSATGKSNAALLEAVCQSRNPPASSFLFHHHNPKNHHHLNLLSTSITTDTTTNPSVFLTLYPSPLQPQQLPPFVSQKSYLHNLVGATNTLICSLSTSSLPSLDPSVTVSQCSPCLRLSISSSGLFQSAREA